MTRKKPSPVFEILFASASLVPEEIPVSALSRTLAAVNRLSLGDAEIDDDDDEDEEDENGHPDKKDGSAASIRLISVKRGSAIFQCFAHKADLAISNLRVAGRVVAMPDPDKSSEHSFVLKPVEEMSAIAKSLECHIIVRKPGDKSHAIVTVDPSSYERIAGSLLLSGDTTIRGNIERVGGATGMRCAMRVPFQHRLLYCNVASQEVSRRLGQHLYQEIAATGTARWIQRSWKIYAFTIRDIYQPKQGSLHEAFQALRDAGGKAWDRVADPEAFLAEIGARP